MYQKEINGKTIFSECGYLVLDDGRVISNPTQEMIYAQGWEDVPMALPLDEEESTDNRYAELIEDYFAEHATGELQELAQERRQGRIEILDGDDD